MQSSYRILMVAAVLAVASAALASGTVTFTADDSGTFPKTVQYTRGAQGEPATLSIDLSGLEAGAKLFRAELYIPSVQQFQVRPMKPTKVFAEGQEAKPLGWVGPRFVSLDCLEAAKAAIEAKKPLTLKLETVLNTPNKLEISYVGKSPAVAGGGSVKDVKAIHRAGQSLVSFVQPKVKVAYTIAAPFDAPVQKLEIVSGKAVKKGDLLATMDVDELKKQLTEAEKLKADKTKEAEDQDREGQKAEAAKAKGEAQKADADVKRLGGMIANAEVRSPVDGVMAPILGKDGQPVKLEGKLKGGTPLMLVEYDLLSGAYPDFATGSELSKLGAELAKLGMSFRVWRSGEKISPETMDKAKLVGESGWLTEWNSTYHQDGTGGAKPIRRGVVDLQPVAWGTGIYAHNPDKPGKAFYAVSVAVNGKEDFSTIGQDGSATADAADEVVGLGLPVLQWQEDVPADKQWQYRQGPMTRLIYVRWESYPDSATPSKPVDYLVVLPQGDKPGKGGEQWSTRVDPAPVGLHLHCWGGSVNGGYGWYHNGHKGAILLASNQIPYDWWTGFHEANGTSKTFGDGHVVPFSMNREFAILDWAARQNAEAPEAVRKFWPKLDLSRVFTAGSSMGGSGAPMYAIRYGDKIAWCIAWVGVHIPAESPQFHGSYEGSYGPRNEAITMSDGKTSPWDYFSDVWWLTQKENLKKETGFIMASNGSNDGGIGWPQAVKFARALQETRRPHMFNWAPAGHGTRTLIGANFDLDIKADQTLPAFANCSLDEDINKTDSGAYNAHLWWKTQDIVDSPESWEMTVILQPKAPKDECTVDLTPRKLQKFKTASGKEFAYTVTAVEGGKKLSDGTVKADDLDLITLKGITLAKGENRVRITPAK